MTEHKLPPLPEIDVGGLRPQHWFNKTELQDYARQAINPLLTENVKLRKVLSEIIGIAQLVDGWESFPQDAIDTAYAALGESNE